MKRCNLRKPILMCLTLLLGSTLLANLAAAREMVINLRAPRSAEYAKRIIEIVGGELSAGCVIEAKAKKQLTLRGDQEWINFASTMVPLLEAEYELAERKRLFRSAEVLKIYKLQHAQAHQIAEVLLEVYRDLIQGKLLKISADQRVNSLIISGDPETLPAVEALIKELDGAQRKDQEKTVTYVELKALRPEIAVNLHPSPSLDLTVQILGRDMVVVRGPKDRVAQYTRELKDLDRAHSKPSYDVTIRVVWLVSADLLAGDHVAIPADLKEAVNKLSDKLDLGQLQSAGQFMITHRNSKGSRFEGSGTAKFEGGCEIKIGGNVQLVEKQLAKLFIEASAKSGKRTICEMSSTISAPVGHPVILGMTPIDSQPSLFVVQVMEATPAKD